MQLGPIVLSQYATRCGLNVSLLERLAGGSPFHSRTVNGSYNPGFLTKLVQNYRSYIDILDIPSKLYYEKELIACSQQKKLDIQASTVAI